MIQVKGAVDPLVSVYAQSDGQGPELFVAFQTHRIGIGPILGLPVEIVR